MISFTCCSYLQLKQTIADEVNVDIMVPQVKAELANMTSSLAALNTDIQNLDGNEKQCAELGCGFYTPSLIFLFK